jgi:hypothetical protein
MTTREGIAHRVEFCDGCAKVSYRRHRSDIALEASRVQAQRLLGGMFR